MLCGLKITGIISIHAPPRGATPRRLRRESGVLFQFTPLREGRQGEGWQHRACCISIHAPPRGATPLQPSSRLSSTNFNSRPSARGDGGGSRRNGLHGISIHAPPRGATSFFLSTLFRTSDFNSRPSARGDHFKRLRRYCAGYFNSRPSARGDGKRYAISANLLFNPYKSAWLNNSATQFVEIILVIFHRIIV